MKKAESDKDMLDEYDFSGGVRGRYAARIKRGSNVVLLEPDVAKVFPDAASVNNALRALASIIGQTRTAAPKRKSRT